MQPRAQLNLVLLGVILVLGLLVIYTDYREKPVPSPQLTDLTAEQVQNIRIERAEDVIALNKDAQGQWFITEPLNIAAHTFRVDQLLKLLSTTQYQLVNSDSLKLADLKLQPPLVRVVFNELPIAFGDSSPLNDGQRYVQVHQNIYLLLDTLYPALIDEITTFISLSPLGHSPKITELKLPEYHLSLKEGLWQLLSAPPEYVDISADAISGLIGNWQTAQAFTVKPYESKATPQGEVIVTLQGQAQPIHLAIVATEPELIFALPQKGIQYHFSVHQLEKLLYLPKKAVKDEVGHSTTP